MTRKKRWRGGVGLLIGLLAWMPPGLAGAQPSLCERLAQQARQQPDGGRTAGQPLARFVRIETRPAGRPLSALETQLLANPSLREALGVGADEPLGIERLAGTDLYRVDSIQGTAHCQRSVFVEARPGQAPRRLEAPLDEGPRCWTQSGGFGRVFGRAAFVVQGGLDQVRQDWQYRIAPWTGRGWGAACTLDLSFAKRLRLVDRFCGSDASLCKAGAAAAPAIAAAYEADRDKERTLGWLDFAAGLEPPPELKALLGQVPSDLESLPGFPTFAADRHRQDPFMTQYANLTLLRLALWLEGRWWLAVVGRAGVGWREGPTVLLSIFALRDGALLPMAGYRIELGAGRLREARVEED